MDSVKNASLTNEWTNGRNRIYKTLPALPAAKSGGPLLICSERGCGGGGGGGGGGGVEDD